jgi:hypothetical protein
LLNDILKEPVVHEISDVVQDGSAKSEGDRYQEFEGINGVSDEQSGR